MKKTSFIFILFLTSVTSQLMSMELCEDPAQPHNDCDICKQNHDESITYNHRPSIALSGPVCSHCKKPMLQLTPAIRKKIKQQRAAATSSEQ